MFFRVVCLGIDNLRCRLSRDGIVEAVLYHGIEIPCGRGVFVIVRTAFGIDVGYLLPDASFAGTDGTHTLQQFAEVVFAKDRRTLLQPLVVHHESFLDILMQNLRCPLAETGGFQ